MKKLKKKKTFSLYVKIKIDPFEINSTGNSELLKFMRLHQHFKRILATKTNSENNT